MGLLRGNLSREICDLQRRRPACASAQSDQPPCYSLFGKHNKLTTSEISIFKLVSLAEETGLSLALSETPKTGLPTMRPI